MNTDASTWTALSTLPDRITDAIRAGYRIQRGRGIPKTLTPTDMYALARAVTATEDLLPERSPHAAAMRAMRRALEDQGRDTAKLPDYTAVRAAVAASWVR
jgi:hypothetical protein